MNVLHMCRIVEMFSRRLQGESNGYLVFQVLPPVDNVSHYVKPYCPLHFLWLDKVFLILCRQWPGNQAKCEVLFMLAATELLPAMSLILVSLLLNPVTFPLPVSHLCPPLHIVLLPSSLVVQPNPHALYT